MKTARLLPLVILAAAPALAQQAQPPMMPMPADGPTVTAPPAWTGALSRDTLLQRLRAHVVTLAGESMAGRRPATRGNTLAAEYIGRAFERAGLQPVSSLRPSKRDRRKGVQRYFETFPYLHGVEAGRGNKATIARGSAGPDLILAPGADFTPLGFSSSGSASGPLVFVGYGIRDTASGYDDYAGVDARGAIVVMMRYSPEGDVPHGRFANAASWASKVRTAVEKGARGIIFINQPGELGELPPMSFIRGFLNAGIPCLFVSDASIAALRDPSGRTLEQVRRLIDSTQNPASFAFSGHKASITADVKRLEAQVANVVGILPGSDPALRNEVIVIGAHFDHLGTGGDGSLSGSKEPQIHYGADDNASGTAGLLALAEELAMRRDNRRTIMFAAFNAEEEGLLGSAHMVRNLALPKEMKLVTMINMDMIGRLDSMRLTVQGTGTSPGFERMLDSLNPGFSLKLSKEGFGPSDYASFYQKSIPVLGFFTGVHRDYHKPSDTWEKLNFAGQAEIVEYVAHVTTTLDREGATPLFTKADPPANARRTSGFNVYVGTMPDYGYEGKGMRITGTSGGSPAEKAGLVDGDVIVKMGDYPIGNIYDYMDALSHFKPQQEVATEIVRAGKTETVTIVMGNR